MAIDDCVAYTGKEIQIGLIIANAGELSDKILDEDIELADGTLVIE